MTDPIVVDAGDHDAETLLERLRAHGRVVVRREVLGTERELTLRYDGDTYYCDTPTKLHTHRSAEEMKQCMRNAGYVTDAD